MNGCIFCKIASGEVPARKEYEDDFVVAFHDIKPSAPVHVLVIPKKHIESADKIMDEDIEILGRIHKAISEVANKLEITSGYKVVANGGKFQEIKHLHYHLLSGLDNPDASFRKGGSNN